MVLAFRYSGATKPGCSPCHTIRVMIGVVRRLAGERVRRRCRWSTLAIMAASVVVGACSWVDPQCWAPGFRQGDWLVNLTLRLEHTMTAWPYRGRTYTEFYMLTVDAGGGLEYAEGFNEVVVCQRVDKEWLGALADVWTNPALDRSRPLCDPGYAYLPFGHERACRPEQAGARRRSQAYLPSLEMTYYAEDGPVTVSWDLESQLPEALDEAVTGMLGLLCEESGKLARNLSRSLPELAARAGCPSGSA